jgi:hypothetical protein
VAAADLRAQAHPASNAVPAKSGVTAARGWLWGSVLLTAGALGAAVVLAPPAGAQPARALSWLLFTGSSVHVASTGWLFTVPSVRAYAREHRARCLWLPLAMVAVAALAAAALPPAAFGWLLLPYFCWQFFHYAKQNVGMASLAASAQRVRPLQPAERRALIAAGLAAVVALAARPDLLGLHIDPFPGDLFPVAAAGYAAAVLSGLIAIARRASADRPAGFAITYLTSLLFCLPAFVFASPYAAIGGMTVAHGLQYLLLIGVIAGGPAAATARPARILVLANIALIGGAALSMASHLHSASPPARLLFGAYLGIVMAHFVIDAGLWRMRDPLARAFLRGSLPWLAPGRSAAPVIAATDPSSADIGCMP